MTTKHLILSGLFITLAIATGTPFKTRAIATTLEGQTLTAATQPAPTPTSPAPTELYTLPVAHYSPVTLNPNMDQDIPTETETEDYAIESWKIDTSSSRCGTEYKVTLASDSEYGGTVANFEPQDSDGDGSISLSTNSCRLEYQNSKAGDSINLVFDKPYTLTFRSRFDLRGMEPLTKASAYLYAINSSAYIQNLTYTNKQTGEWYVYSPFNPNWNTVSSTFVPVIRSSATTPSLGLTFFYPSKTMNKGLLQIDNAGIYPGVWSFGQPEFTVIKGLKPKQIAVDILSVNSDVTPQVEIAISTDGKTFQPWTKLADDNVIRHNYKIDELDVNDPAVMRIQFKLESVSEITKAKKIRWRVSESSHTPMVSRLGYVRTQSAHPRLLGAHRLKSDGIYAYGSDKYNAWLTSLKSNKYNDPTNWIVTEEETGKLCTHRISAIGDSIIAQAAFGCLAEQKAINSKYSIKNGSVTPLSDDNICTLALHQLWEFLALWPVGSPSVYTLKGDASTNVNITSADQSQSVATCNGEDLKVSMEFSAKYLSFIYDWNNSLLDAPLSDVRTFLESKGKKLHNLQVADETSMTFKDFTAYNLMASAGWLNNNYATSPQSVYGNHYAMHMSPITIAGDALMGDRFDTLESSSLFKEFKTNTSYSGSAWDIATELFNMGDYISNTIITADNEDKADGTHEEGLVYGYRHRFVDSYLGVWSHESVSGIPLRKQNNFYKNATRAFLYHIQPNFNTATFGDISSSYASNTSYYLSNIIGATVLPNITDALMNRSGLLNDKVAFDSTAIPFFYLALLARDPNTALDLEDVVTTWPLSKTFTNYGLFTSRDKWDFRVTPYPGDKYASILDSQDDIELNDSLEPENNFALYLHAGKELNDHPHRDNGHVIFWPFLIENGCYGCDDDETNPGYNSQYRTQAVAHNSLLVYDQNETTCTYDKDANNDGKENDPLNYETMGGYDLDVNWPCGQSGYDQYLGTANLDRFATAKIIAGGEYKATANRGAISYALADITKSYDPNKLDAFYRETIWFKTNPLSKKSYLLIWDRVGTINQNDPTAIVFHADDLRDSDGNRLSNGELLLDINGGYLSPANASSTDINLTSGSSHILGTQYTRYADESLGNADAHGYYMHFTSVFPQQQKVRFLIGDADQFRVGNTFDSNLGVFIGGKNYPPSSKQDQEISGLTKGHGRIEIYDATKNTTDSFFLTVGEPVYSAGGMKAIPTATPITQLADEPNFAAVSLDDPTHQIFAVLSKNLSASQSEPGNISFDVCLIAKTSTLFFSGLLPSSNYTPSWTAGDNTTCNTGKRYTVTLSSGGSKKSTKEGVLIVNGPLEK